MLQFWLPKSASSDRSSRLKAQTTFEVWSWPKRPHAPAAWPASRVWESQLAPFLVSRQAMSESQLCARWFKPARLAFRVSKQLGWILVWSLSWAQRDSCEQQPRSWMTPLTKVCRCGPVVGGFSRCRGSGALWLLGIPVLVWPFQGGLTVWPDLVSVLTPKEVF